MVQASRHADGNRCLEAGEIPRERRKENRKEAGPGQGSKKQQHFSSGHRE